jgi:hypothetical protein
MMIVPEAANLPPTPWQTEIFASGIWARTVPRVWRTHRQMRELGSDIEQGAS